MTSPDPFRADAAVVWRSLRDDGPASAVELASRLFPDPVDAPETTKKAVAKRGKRRVLDSLVWMRHQGVSVWASPSDAGTIFSLSKPLHDPVVTPVTPVKSKRSERSEEMDIWHPDQAT